MAHFRWVRLGFHLTRFVNGWWRWMANLLKYIWWIDSTLPSWFLRSLCFPSKLSLPHNLQFLLWSVRRWYLLGNSFCWVSISRAAGTCHCNLIRQDTPCQSSGPRSFFTGPVSCWLQLLSVSIPLHLKSYYIHMDYDYSVVSLALFLCNSILAATTL